jgi:hypothetical protein
VSVEAHLYRDLQCSEEILLVSGYASLQHLCHFISSSELDTPRRIRMLFGHEPALGREVPVVGENDTLTQEVMDYWLGRGISILHALDVLRTLEALERKRLTTRVSRRIHISDPVLVSPPAVGPTWADELHGAEVRVEAHSHGALSSGRAGAHHRVVSDVEAARILALDEAHNFINASHRTALVTTNLADHVVNSVLFDVCADCPLGSAELEGTGSEGHGATAWLVTTAPVVPGENFVIQFGIMDAGDGITGSSILIDNFRWDPLASG